MKVIFMARKALAAYLISSDVRREVKSSGASVEIERPVDFGHDAAGALVIEADDNAVGTLEILDGGTFAQEFRIGDDGDICLRIGFAHDALHFVAGADRYGRFGDDDREAFHVLGDLAGGGMDVGKVGMAVAAPRRGADRDEDDVACSNARLHFRRERETSGADIVCHQLLQARLEDRYFAAPQCLDLARVLVDANDIMAEIGKANT